MPVFSDEVEIDRKWNLVCLLRGLRGPPIEEDDEQWIILTFNYA